VAAVELDLRARQRLHVVGVGGAGMSAIATVLVAMGHDVSGSDLRESATLDRLRSLGIPVAVGHRPGNVPDPVDAVVVSSATAPSNPEVRTARDREVRVLRRADALAAIVASRPTVAVAGSHGKTTTSSMLALILRAAGRRPSFVIGGDLNEVGTNAQWDDGDLVVVEADESDGTFLELAPHHVVVTSVLPDHLDHYGTLHGLVRAFEDFVRAAPGTRVVCADDPVAAALCAPVDAVSYGFAAHADYRIVEYRGSRTGSHLVLTARGEELGAVELAAPGRHNALNAVGATAIALELGVAFGAVQGALAGFGGVARRFQHRGERGGVTFVDDYAHLPGDVEAMIEAAREGGWRRIVAVFQPHRFSRTASLWRDFADVFRGADTVVLTDVYPAGEQPRPGVSGRLLLQAVLDSHPEQSVVYLPRRADLVEHVPPLARPGDLVLTLGAGDLTTLPDDWLARA
jgi:UDP-N-acetylmuramate--alanine ligase